MDFNKQERINLPEDWDKWRNVTWNFVFYKIGSISWLKYYELLSKDSAP